MCLLFQEFILYLNYNLQVRGNIMINAIEQNIYLGTAKKANHYIYNRIMNSQVPLNEYNSKFLESWSKNDGLFFFPFEYTGIAKEKVAGHITYSPNGIAICYNESNPIKRQRFTIMHELSHYLFHLDVLKRENELVEYLSPNSLYYSETGSQLEFQANISASIFLIPDIVLIDKIAHDSFKRICSDYQISAAALYVRLVQMIEFNFNVSEERSRQAVNNYRYSETANNRWLHELSQTLRKQIIDKDFFYGTVDPFAQKLFK